MPLEHLISCVPGVNVTVSKSGVKKVLWAENKPLQPIGACVGVYMYMYIELVPLRHGGVFQS